MALDDLWNGDHAQPTEEEKAERKAQREKEKREHDALMEILIDYAWADPTPS
jgi:hypothetical protein